MVQVEAAQSRPQARSAPSGSSRRLQMLVKQRERLEVQLRELESEILTMVGCRPSIGPHLLTAVKEAAQKRR